MASPLKSGKQSVDLAARAVPGSRIRRDPPPPVQKIVVRDPEDRDRRMVIIGVASFALAIFAIVIGWGSYDGSIGSDTPIYLNNL
jgi:hypothetical protein